MKAISKSTVTIGTLAKDGLPVGAVGERRKTGKQNPERNAELTAVICLSLPAIGAGLVLPISANGGVSQSLAIPSMLFAPRDVKSIETCSKNGSPSI